MKFGGHVLSRETGIRDALEVIATQRPIWDNLVVVISALRGVTDALHTIVDTARSGNQSALRADIASLRGVHIEAAHFTISNPRLLESLLQELDVLFFNLLDTCDLIRRQGQNNPALADRVVAMGEMWVTRLVAAAGREMGLDCVSMDASRLIITDDRHANARPITSLSQQFLDQNLLPLLQRGIVPIITGYLGANKKGEVTTLGRGGSDFSATYLASLLGATEVWFFSDVDGLMTADPDAVPGAHVLAVSSYREVAQMAKFGTRLLHPLAMEPLMQAHISLRIRPLNPPDSSGTFIYAHRDPQVNRIHAVTQALGVCILGQSQSNLTEVCNRLISQYLNDDIQPSLQVDTYAGCRVVYVAPTTANPEDFFKGVDQLQQYDSGDEWEVDQVTVVAVIGALTLEDHIMVFGVLAAAGITPLVIGQGSPDVLLLVVMPDQAETALNAVHTLIGV